MKQLLSTMLALILALAVLGPSFAPVQGSSLPAGQEFLPEVRHFTAGGIEAPVVRGLPERPERHYPIPYHRPGQPAKTSVANGARLAEAYGLSQPLTMTAALELGVLDDPFQENYSLVNWDQIVMAGQPVGSDQVLVLGLQAAELITDSPHLAPPVDVTDPWQEQAAWIDGPGAVAADLNGDGWDESIAIYNDLSTDNCRLAVGNMGDQAGRLTSAPAMALFYDGATPKLLAAIRGYDGGVWIRRYDDPTWGAWQPLGGNLASAPAVAGGADAAEVFYLDAGGALVGIDALGVTTETLGTPPGVDLTLDPAAARWGTRTDVFVRGADNAVWHRARQGSSWDAWESLGGFITSSPAAVWQSSDRLDLVARGYDQALWHRVYSGGAWGAWQRVGGELASAPAILSAASGSFEVFALNAAGEALHLAYAGGAWGSWENLGGELTSAPAAAWLEGTTRHLLARGPDNGLWHTMSTGGPWGSWTLLDRLPDYVVTELPFHCNVDHRDQGAGHFLGDGREQLLLRDGGTLRLYQASRSGGFFMEFVAQTAVQDGVWPDVGETLAVGDFDGNGIEEFALLATNGTNTSELLVYQVYTTTHQFALMASRPWPVDPPPEGITHGYSLAAGDLNGDAIDELIYGGMEYNITSLLHKVPFYIFILEEGAPGWTLEWTYKREYDCPSYMQCAHAVSVANVDGAGPDELATAYVWRTIFDPMDGTVWTNAYGVSEALTGTVWIGTNVSMNFEGTSWLHHYLHAADLDRDFTDEFLLQLNDSTGDPTTNITYIPRFQVEWMDPDRTFHALPGGWFSYGPFNRWVDLDIGNLTGQGLRVGPPTVRYQNDVRGIEVMISEPPKHKDFLGGVLYNINASDQGTYSQYEEDASHTEEISLQAQRDWTLDVEASATLGKVKETHLTASIGASYGDHFEKTNGEFQKLEMQTTARADSSDLIIYTRSDFKIYEYPFYQNDPTAPIGYMTVVFQQNADGLETSWGWGSQCDFWYRPNHQNHNVWSYPDGQDGFVNMDPERGVISCGTTFNVGAGETSFEVAWEAGQTEKLSSEVEWKIKAGLEGQVGGDSILVWQMPWQVNFEVKGSYGETRTELQKMSATEGTGVGGRLNNLPPEYQVSAAYDVNPCLYWSKAGYLVLDWWARPGAGDFWADNYASPDPAFTHLYEEGQCSILGTDFSSDVTVDPPKAAPGTVVTATAIVRNFSDEGASNVRVRLYVGDPAAGGVAIEPDACLGATLIDGDCQIDALPDRARQEVSILFTASGAGEQRIYAVLDPDGAIAEVHEDNNTAYGRLQLAAAGYADPGAVPNVPPALGIDHSYARYVYTDTQGTQTSALVPLLALSETTLIELRQVLSPSPPPGMMSAHHAFDLLAFQGAEGSGWVEPVDLTFGGSLPAALAVVEYTDADWLPGGETDLVLKYWTGTAWQDAACAGMEGQVLQSVDENWLLVPVCQTGSYALFTPYAPSATVYLPLVLKVRAP